MSTRIALVACSKSKMALPAGEKIAARDLYTGTLFCRASAYARAVCEEWYILSAKHGLVAPDTPLTSYDLSLYDLSARRRAIWAAGVMATIDMLYLDTPHTRWLILAGKVYREHIVPRLRGNIEVPLEGLGIGQQIAELNRMLTDLENIDA